MSLRVRNLTKSFGGLKAVRGVDLDALPGEVTSVIGPNGAGKTTLLNLVSGNILPDAGTVHLMGRDVTRCTPHVLAEHGLARTYQSPQLFEDMTVLETVMVGAHLRGRSGFLSTGLRLPRIAGEEREMEERAVAALRRVDFPEELYGRDALELPYGHQRRAEIARAMAMSPGALLLDEPAAGLNATETAEISGLIADLARGGMIVVLVEHDMAMVMGISHRILVMSFGERLAFGPPGEIQRDPRVIDAYLGTEEDAEDA